MTSNVGLTLHNFPAAGQGNRREKVTWDPLSPMATLLRFFGHILASIIKHR